jgi:hypothetical protein
LCGVAVRHECLLFSGAASHRMSQGRATQIIDLSVSVSITSRRRLTGSHLPPACGTTDSIHRGMGACYAACKRAC